MPMQTVHRTEAMEAVHCEDNIKGTDESATDGSPTDKEDPWNPPNFVFPDISCPKDSVDYAKIKHRAFLEIFAATRATAIISPDRTPEVVHAKFHEIRKRLLTILRKDSVPCFIRLFQHHSVAMAYGFIFTPQTLNLIVACNALRCAKVILEGKARRLEGYRANPNYMTYLGYFPLHQAAENFSIDMIELLLRYNASANLRTSGDYIIEGLLPLHVAVENTCMHKYLEDNLLSDQKYNQDNVDLIYKIIHLLCLPQMKIFLDTIRVLANYTDNVVDELWNYIEEGKLVHAAILLLAAQEQLRDLNGFATIKTRIMDSTFSLCMELNGLASGKKSKAHKQLMEKDTFLNSYAGPLVVTIDRAGEALDAYIQTHSGLSHREVIGSVSSILQDHGFAPSGDIGELVCSPFNCGDLDGVLHEEHGETDVPKAAMGSPNVNVEAKDVASSELRRRQVLEHTRKLFLPYWRSALRCKSGVMIYPSYAPFHPEQTIQYLVKASGSRKVLKNEGYFPIRLGLQGRIPQASSSYRFRRLFGTAAFAVLKILKHA